MEQGTVIRDDFPQAHGTDGFDVDSVKAHLAAVAAQVAALEARIAALEVEREKLRQQLADAREREDAPSGLPEPGPDPLEHLVSGEPADAAADPEPDEAAGAAPGEDEVAARLLASKLAMEGKSRDTIVMQLAAEHEIDDPGHLVDDVLARLG